MSEIQTILKHCASDLEGHVKCEVCKEITEIKKPIYFAVYRVRGILVLGMVGFACEKCFNKEHTQSLCVDEIKKEKTT
jgi:hypothetical protein